MSMGSIAHVRDDKKELVCDVHRLARLDVKPKQDLDPVLVDLKKSVSEKAIGFLPRENGVIRYQGRLCVPNVDELRNKILT
ncbi:hypothetical protein MTR67_001763 [Solanum verrucosum]|uniref:Uncharacterized protein n=1 Tax=Solanum verrucosum TaxID=315347 RepID=A0AAF0T8Q7_SOLVR|nr:hypothetical protein MTR67_001763 [Solanum verrucosum]